MSDAVPGEDRLFEEALDLIIRLQNDPSNPVNHEMVRRWRARGPEHDATWAEVAEIHGMAGQVIADDRRARRGAPGVTRRTLVIAGLAGGVAAAAGYTALPGLLLDARADYVTGTAEIRRVELPDGSTATLGPDSAIALRFGDRLRQVELLAGMAFLEVATEAARPFQVAVAELTATALGTAFDISSDAGFLSVAVDHGAVEVRLPAPEAAAAGRLEAGQWVTFDQRSRAVLRGTRDIGQIGSWRQGQIFAENEPVGSVVAKIARWQPGRILIADPWFGASHISGVFDLNDPLRALEAVVHPFGGRVRQMGRYLTVISPV